MSWSGGHSGRVAGHALQNEGARRYGDHGWGAFAVTCSCGKVRRVESQAEAKRWHRQHKQDIVEGRDPRGTS